MKKLLSLVFVVIVFAAKAQVEVSAIPEWYDNPPSSSRKLYAAGTATAPSLEVAEKKAMMDAKSQLARQVGQVKYISRDGEKITTEVVKAELRNVRVERKKVISSSSSHTVFLLVSMKKKDLRRDEATP